MRRNWCKGSITVFAALSMMLVAQLLFTLLESARNAQFYKVLQMNSDSVLESMFADYVTPLWENYRLLGICVQDGEGHLAFTHREAQLRNLSKANLGTQKQSALEGNSMLTAEMTDVQFQSVLLMTDQQGKVFQAAVTSYMKNNLAYETAQNVYNTYESIRDAKNDYGDGEGSIADAISALENLKGDTENVSEKAAGRMRMKGVSAGTGKSISDQTYPQDETQENLLTMVAETQKRGILELVLPESTKISGVQMNLEQTVSHRTLETGSGGRTVEGDWYDQVLMNQYLVHYLADYTKPADGHRLNYELEYLIAGKAKDSANLKIAVSEILAIREAMNLASLTASPQKQSQALAMATLIAGATVNPLIIAAVKYGILAAWAYAESILDLRALLQGEKIAVVKNDVDWSSDLEAIPGLLSGWSKAKSSRYGISYTDYLGMLLFFHSGQQLAMRAMDVQEAAVRQMEGYESFRMDCLVCETSVCTTYEYAPVFMGFVTLVQQNSDRIGIQRSARYSYLENLQQTVSGK